MLLGTSPSKCEPIENPRPIIGISFDVRQEQPIIFNVMPKSPAHQAGLRAGDTIKSIGGERISTYKQAISVLQNILVEGEAVDVETNRGIVSVVPMIPKAEQCYWEVQAGRIGKSGSLTLVDKYGGASSSGSSNYERFFRASCRISDGFVVGCRANWQE